MIFKWRRQLLGLSAPSGSKAARASPLSLASLVLPLAQRPLQWRSHRSLPPQRIDGPLGVCCDSLQMVEAAGIEPAAHFITILNYSCF